MDERLKFITRLLEGEKMAPVCQEFGISRVTGYKIFNRHKDCGLDGLNDRALRPYVKPTSCPSRWCADYKGESKLGNKQCRQPFFHRKPCPVSAKGVGTGAVAIL